MVNPIITPKLKILLVDDDADTRQLVSMMFADSGHKLLTATSGKAARTLLEHEKVDLILLDIIGRLRGAAQAQDQSEHTRYPGDRHFG